MASVTCYLFQGCGRLCESEGSYAEANLLACKAQQVRQINGLEVTSPSALNTPHPLRLGDAVSSSSHSSSSPPSPRSMYMSFPSNFHIHNFSVSSKYEGSWRECSGTKTSSVKPNEIRSPCNSWLSWLVPSAVGSGYWQSQQLLRIWGTLYLLHPFHPPPLWCMP